MLHTIQNITENLRDIDIIDALKTAFDAFKKASVPKTPEGESIKDRILDGEPYLTYRGANKFAHKQKVHQLKNKFKKAALWQENSLDIAKFVTFLIDFVQIIDDLYILKHFVDRFNGKNWRKKINTLLTTPQKTLLLKAAQIVDDLELKNNKPPSHFLTAAATIAAHKNKMDTKNGLSLIRYILYHNTANRSKKLKQTPKSINAATLIKEYYANQTHFKDLIINSQSSTA